MKKISEKYEVVVCGGGMAGFTAAVAAARMGRSTCLIQNRPVFGGNCSSEIGVTIHGAAAFHAYARETGIISELLIEERATNHAEIYENGWVNSVWDMVLYDTAVNTEHLSFHLNTELVAVNIDENRKIKSVLGRVMSAELELLVEGKIFIDCTGDGVIADMAGCEWRMGTESKSEFNEIHAPEEASDDVMGNSIHFRTRDMGRLVPYKAPEWAIKYKDASYFYEQGRIPKDKRGGFWWLEIGVPHHTIHDNEKIRHELTRHALGVWDWMKNYDPVMKKQCENYALDWIGQVPGKRESRRIIGEYFMTENDIQDKKVFEDEIGFGGWFVDLHTPGGLLAEHAEQSAASDGEEYDTFNEYSVKSYCGPYGFPLRILIARDVENLMMAGRNISASHAALGTLRVMGTTALMGQATGVAAATALINKISIKQVPTLNVQDVKQQLLRDGCFLLNNKNEDSNDLARTATITASSQELLYGAAPETKGSHEGLFIWKDQPQYKKESIETQKGQPIAVGSDRIDSVAVCLTNLTDHIQKVEAFIFPISNIWDYRVRPAKPIATTTLNVPVGKNIWIYWDVNLDKNNGLPIDSFIRLDLAANSNLEWKEAGCIIPGHTAMYQIGEDKMRRFNNGSTLSFKVHPGQDCFKPSNIISGITRPFQYTNLWVSDKNLPLDQWIELSWNSPKKVSQIELTFPGHLLRELHAYSPFYRDPQCPKDYEIWGFSDNEWEKLLSIKDNYQRQRKHLIASSKAYSKIKVIINSTNGDPAAQIYEIRIY
ncbi:FAD-dependent oxidoreductase [Chondrinema litorale]|uniref:FAD-dependent oxidoreductase n=1 Tax=Chondrinema litorale TaxID=2994555 RepID=UPI002542BC1C|nr:FAD-dependent oxidoreductase [Chondrinema litorale]UZR96649.1 FAD-dependent oxidoreductase [Chondrinema litorale]